MSIDKTTRYSQGWIRIVILIGVLITIAVILFIVKKGNGNGETTTTVTRGNITETVTATGQLSAQGIAEIYPESTGIITEIYVADGTDVVEGQKLFSVKSTATAIEQQKAYAALLVAQTNLNNAISIADSLRSTMYGQWDEFFNLATNDTYETDEGKPKDQERTSAEFQTTKYDWLASEKRYKNQQSAISAAQASVEAMQKAYDATQNSTTLSPASGIVANIVPTVGDRVTALPSLSATPILTLTNFSSFSIDVDIKETDITKIMPGQTVTVTIDALPNKVFDAQVSNVSLLGKNDAGVINYTVRIKLLDNDPKIRHMMTATTNIVIDNKSDVLTIPPASLQEQDGIKGVVVISKGKKLWRPIIVGAQNGSAIEVIEGLNEGEEVVIPTIQ